VIFTDLRFLLLFAGCWVSLAIAPAARRAAVLAVWGTAFYTIYAGLPATVLVVALVTGAVFSHRRAAAWLAGAAVCGLLGFFKTAENPYLMGQMGLAGVARWIMPLGFSYLSFELLHVILERRRGRIQSVSFVDLLAYAFFLPCRIAGPIRRFPDFTAAVGQAGPSADNLYAGVVRILIGFGKKLVLADTLALTGAELPHVTGPTHAWTIVLAYTFRIYFDFSAYSDLAIGFSRLLGIRVPENFSHPYLAVNIREFWNRWHITLSHWVRDYIFVPTGRTLFGTFLRPWPVLIATASYLATFLVVGAWHGITGAYLAWGAYHGFLLSAHHVIRTKIPPSISDHAWYRSRLASAFSAVITFAFVAIGWVLFMTDLATARRLLVLMFGGGRL
jgi:alginate O-acetyltransferase complex protein AlgI